MPGVELEHAIVDCSRYAGWPLNQGVVDLFHLRSRSVELSVTNYGAIITRLTAPDRRGVRRNVVLGHVHPGEYFVNPAYLGAIIGRYANRIGGAAFDLDDVTHSLDANEGRNHIHGGSWGFDRHVWSATTTTESDASTVTFWRISPDGEQGYPGALAISVSYTLRRDGEVILDYEARAHAPTIVNLTQHTYFNLSGHRDVRSHELTINADFITPVGPGLIPTGTLAPVHGTPFDFRAAARIADRLALRHPQLGIAGGFDHNWALRSAGRAFGMVHAARLYDPISGRRLDVSTTEPGLQFYDGHLLGGSASNAFPAFAGLCLETQHYPDSPNHKHFPTTVVRPCAPYRSRTIWRFSVV